MESEVAVESITIRWLGKDLVIGDLVDISRRPDSSPGSAEYTPSTFLASRMASALISAARSTAPVSVEKNGLPVPQPKITTRPFSRWRMALAADIGLGDAGHLNGSLHADLNAALLQTVGHSQRS